MWNCMDSSQVLIVDTPGAYDGEHEDATFDEAMGRYFGKCGGINAFCLVIQITHITVSSSLQNGESSWYN